MAICKYCKIELPKNRKSFCSNKCQGKYEQKRVILKCKICGNTFQVRKKEVEKRTVKYCSNKCRGLGRKIESREKRICPTCKIEFEVYKKSTKKYCSNKCATMATGKIRAKKARETLKRKYGIDFIKTDIFKEKSKETKLRKYGDKNYVNINKAKKTKLKKYGNENYNNPEKNKKTCLLKYGVENPSQYFKIREKIKNTFFNQICNRIQDVVTPLFLFDEYQGIEKKYQFQCKKCNNVFEDTLNNGKIPRCLYCYPLTRYYSGAEKEIVNYLKQIYVGNIIENDKKTLNGQELDIFIPEKNIAIEFNGLFWHSEIGGEKDKNYHLNKTIDCEKQNIRLIQIFEDEWLYKQDIVKSRLKNILGISNNRIFARDCVIKEISTKEKNNFLNLYHIQGEDKSKVKIGLFNNNEIVAVMTFGDLRIALGSKSAENEYELIRYATSKSVVGGAGKLFSYFVDKYKPKKVISYADRRWTFHQNNLYEKLGFSKVSNGFPNYWYIKNGQRFHRFNFRKNTLFKKLEQFDTNLTEWQNMQLNGYDRIWDCGHLKYQKLFG